MSNLPKEEKETIDPHDIVWVETTKNVFQVKVMRIPYSDMPFDDNYFKIK